jgi:hypothetical protein
MFYLFFFCSSSFFKGSITTYLGVIEPIALGGIIIFGALESGNANLLK